MPVSCGNGLAENQIRDLEKIFHYHFPMTIRIFCLGITGLLLSSLIFVNLTMILLMMGPLPFMRYSDTEFQIETMN